MTTNNINKKIKQINKTIVWGQDMLELNELDTPIYPYRLIVLVQECPYLEMYINNDLMPVFLDENGYFDWSCENPEGEGQFGQFETLYFVKPIGYNNEDINCFITLQYIESELPDNSE